MADMSDFLEVGRHHNHRELVGKRALDQPIDFRLRANVDARGRILCDEQPSNRREPASDDDFLLIAARQTLDR